MSTPQPPVPAVVRAARFPDEYGQSPQTRAELTPWDDVVTRIAASRNYLVATVAADGSPHVRPVDGVFVLGALCFGGSPQTRWVRNLSERPEVSVSLPDDEHAVILEGRAQLIDDPTLPLSAALGPANMAKYPQYFEDGPGEFQPFWCLRPSRVFSWSLTGFPRLATRYDFEPAASPKR